MKACIFDLDGVLVDTAKYHFVAWKRLADSLQVPFDETDNEQLKGLSRDASLIYILDKGNIHASPSEFAAWTDQKNGWYLELVLQMEAEEALPNVRELLSELKSQNIKIALGSASKNAELILDRLGITDLFDAIVDGTKTTKSKPDPEVFLLGAKSLGFAPNHCIVFEDALMGVKAAKLGGFKCVGVGEESILTEADIVVPNLNQVNVAWLQQNFAE